MSEKVWGQRLNELETDLKSNSESLHSKVKITSGGGQTRVISFKKKDQ